MIRKGLDSSLNLLEARDAAESIASYLGVSVVDHSLT